MVFSSYGTDFGNSEIGSPDVPPQLKSGEPACKHPRPFVAPWERLIASRF